MSIELQGLDRITKKIDAMRHKIAHLEHSDIPHELSDWQVADVHRHKPFTLHTRTGAKTRFRPHSKYEMHRHQLAMRRILKHHGVLRLPSTRPILRQVMIDRLRERMTKMLHDKLRWGG
jgi:hypothetical protein